SNRTLSVNFNDIQYPETRIQDQSILSMVFIAAVKLDFKILCNYRVNNHGIKKLVKNENRKINRVSNNKEPAFRNRSNS
ncbi:hypothetical protein D1BOALGB6SA_2386, partial [Olavius sp. associated proteobacterium Delta 1]